MKRPTHARDPTPDDDGDPTSAKKRKQDEGEAEEGGDEAEARFAHLDENLLFEVLKHADARTLATAACVSKQWHRTAQDERLWEIICMRQWPNAGCGNQQLRLVVGAFGGFRKLHAVILRLASPGMLAKAPAPWGKDEVHLWLSLMSIRFYEKMNPIKRGR